MKIQKKNNIKQIGCNHSKGYCYDYKLVGSELNLCQRCEKLLRKQILQQNKIETEKEVK